MLSKNVENALNEQVTREFFSSNLYLSMASWAESNGFSGSAQFLYQQAEEERIHALKLFKYINMREGHAMVDALQKPEFSFTTIQEIFKKVLEHEKYISKSINDLVGVCMDERDFTTANFLQWYVNEQIEEENTARGILDRLMLIGDDKGKLYMFDRDITTIRAEAAADKTTA